MRATRYEHGTIVGSSPRATFNGMLESTMLHNKPVRGDKEEFTPMTAIVFMLAVIPFLIAIVITENIPIIFTDAFGWWLISWLLRALQCGQILTVIAFLVLITRYCIHRFRKPVTP